MVRLAFGFAFWGVDCAVFAVDRSLLRSFAYPVVVAPPLEPFCPPLVAAVCLSWPTAVEPFLESLRAFALAVEFAAAPEGEPSAAAMA